MRVNDFNDLSRSEGHEAVREVVSAAIVHAARVTEVSGVPEAAAGGNVVTQGAASPVDEVTASASASIPGLDERPAYRVFDDPVRHNGETLRAGVWLFSADKEGNPSRSWLCSPLYVEAITHDGQGYQFGRRLRFRDSTGIWRHWAMPMEMLRGSADELRGELLAMGVEIDPQPRNRQSLSAYLQHEKPLQYMRCTQRTGWCDGTFVLPDTAYGPRAAEVIYQDAGGRHDAYLTAGTLEDWQEAIARRAIGNPLLVLALSAAFCGPLLALCNAEGGGLHFVGNSSTGKTTLLEACCSVWGGPNYRRSWRATANGIEGAACLFNDGLLALDEISECEPGQVSEIIYSVANGYGKQRASRTGSARTLSRWRCVVISSGERSIATAMEEGGKRIKAGQSVRLLDIPVSNRHGAWEELHGYQSGAALSDALKRAAATHHGHAGRAFLARLANDPRDFCAHLEAMKSGRDWQVLCSDGQEKRVLAKFALLALAGELATGYGLTGWPEGAATNAALLAFESWRSQRGHGNGERMQVLDAVANFIERHGDSRFSNVDAQYGPVVHERAGWWRDSGQGREFLFSASGMREALKGFDFKQALDTLVEAGVLPPRGADGKPSDIVRVQRQPTRVYRVCILRLAEVSGCHGMPA